MTCKSTEDFSELIRIFGERIRARGPKACPRDRGVRSEGVGAPPPSWTGCGPPGLHLWRGFFIIYCKIFHGVSGHSENFCFLHINHTMVILWKTVSVRVSSIQIIQVRVQNKGKSVWKSRYVGDVSIDNLSGYSLASVFPTRKHGRRYILRKTTTTEQGSI